MHNKDTTQMENKVLTISVDHEVVFTPVFFLRETQASSVNGKKISGMSQI
jgi:hypothetical protein